LTHMHHSSQRMAEDLRKCSIGITLRYWTVPISARVSSSLPIGNTKMNGGALSVALILDIDLKLREQPAVADEVSIL